MTIEIEIIKDSRGEEFLNVCSSCNAIKKDSFGKEWFRIEDDPCVWSKLFLEYSDKKNSAKSLSSGTCPKCIKDYY